MDPTPPPSEPRVAHYLFAHRAVPRAFLRNPPAILGILGSDDGMRFLEGMWEVMNDALQPHERIDDHPLALRCYALPDDVFVAMVTMPPVHRVFEAYFVACVARLERDPFARAFTLDLAGVPGDEHDTGILEWDAEGNHTVLAPRCAPSAAAFVDTLEALLEARS